MEEKESIKHSTLTIYLLVNVSASMNGSKIGSVNDVIENLLYMLNEMSIENVDIKMNALNVSNSLRWLYDKPVLISNFIWQNIQVGGSPNYGTAFLELNHKLSQDGSAQGANTSFSPIILLISDSAPSNNYNEALTLLKSNNWFKRSIKFAITIGNIENKDSLIDFTESKDNLLTVSNIEAFRSALCLKFVKPSTRNANSVCQNKSELHEVLHQIIKNEGETVLLQTRLVNILSDLQVFQVTPSAKYIISGMIKEGYMQKLLQIGEWNNSSKQLVNQFVKKTGFQQKFVSHIFQCIAFGLDWISIIDENILD